MNEKLRVLDLFSGIGGFSLGLERTGGFETVAFCEIEPYCRAVLKKHWPDVRQYDDVRTLTADKLRADGISVDVICGGFPCQDISTAGKGAGIDGERSGLWKEYARLIGALRPRYVVVENVAALLGRGLDRVLGDLAALGFDAEWHCIPASAVGAPHRRERIWIIANSHEVGRDRAGAYLDRAHVICDRPQWPAPTVGGWRYVVDWLKSPDADGLWEASYSENSGMDDGLPERLELPRIGACGNAVVPQIPEIIGYAILKAEGERVAA